MSFLRQVYRVFQSPSEPRLRSGWRLIAQLILMLLLMLLAGLPAVFLMSLWPAGADLVLIAWTGGPMALSIVIARRLFDRRSVASLGLQITPLAVRDLLAGIAIAAAQTGLVFLLQISFGWLKVEGYAWQQQAPLVVIQEFLLWLAIFLAVGFYEEFFSRGYQLQNLEEGLNTFWGVLLSSMVFGLLHLINPNSSWAAAVGISLSGLFLAYAYLRTRQLWLPIGLHIGWNLFLGPVFGFPVSGLENPRLIITQVSGPDLITGGAFGPEAGLLLLPALGVGLGLVWLVSRGRLSREVLKVVK